MMFEDLVISVLVGGAQWALGARGTTPEQRDALIRFLRASHWS